MTNEEYAALDDISKLKFLRDGLCFDGFVKIGDKILRESTIPKELMPPITEDERDTVPSRPIHIYIDEASQEVFHREKLYVQAVNPLVGAPYVNIGQVKGIHDAEQGKPQPMSDAPPIIIGVPADWPIPDPTDLIVHLSSEKTRQENHADESDITHDFRPGAQIMPADAIERAAKAGCEVWDAWQTRSKYYDKTWHDVARAVILAYLGRSLEDNADRPLVGRVCAGSDPGYGGGDDAVMILGQERVALVGVFDGQIRCVNAKSDDPKPTIVPKGDS